MKVVESLRFFLQTIYGVCSAPMIFGVLKYYTLLLVTMCWISTSPVYSQMFVKVQNNVIVSETNYSIGCSWGRLNQDSYLDVFVSNLESEFPRYNNLYQNNFPVSPFVNVTSGDLVNFLSGAAYGIWADYDNDGDEDIVVLHQYADSWPDPVIALYNNRQGQLEMSILELEDSINASSSISWADFDDDGDLDLFLTSLFENGLIQFDNLGGGEFRLATETRIVQDTITGLQVNWMDIDNDMDLDVFIKDNPNRLYKNNGNGEFLAVVNDPLVNDLSAGLGASWADYDNDGDLDVFIPVSSSRQNLLYQNNDGSFTRVNTGTIVTDSANSTSSSWGDFDNDGLLDLFVSNFEIGGANNSLYRNEGNGSFVKLNNEIVSNDGGSSIGCSWADYDNDGDLDLFVSNTLNEPNFFYENSGNPNNWIKIRCQGLFSNRSALGTRIKIKALIDGVATWQLREIQPVTGAFAQNSLDVEFGLKNANSIDSLLIIWPKSRIVDTYTNVLPNQSLVAKEGSSLTVLSQRTNRPFSFSLEQNYPNPFNSITVIPYSIEETASMSLILYDISGRQISLLFNKSQAAGEYTYELNSQYLPSGVYFYVLKNFKKNKQLVRKTVIVK